MLRSSVPLPFLTFRFGSSNYLRWNFRTIFIQNYTFLQLDRKHITIDAPEGAYSLVDVDAVDLKKYPGLAEAPWWQANMEAGDCIFIPSRFDVVIFFLWK